MGDVIHFIPALGEELVLKPQGKPAPFGGGQVGEIGPIIPCAFEQQEGKYDADRNRNEGQNPAHRPRDHVDDGIHTQMRAFLDRIGCAQQDQPTKQEHRQFQPPKDVGIEAFARDHIGKSDQRHGAQQYGNEVFLKPVDECLTLFGMHDVFLPRRDT